MNIVENHLEKKLTIMFWTQTYWIMTWSLTKWCNIIRINSQNIKKFWSYLKTDDKKAAETDKIPPKLVKLSAIVLSQLLVNAINKSISRGVFPDNTQTAPISPANKQSNDKNKVSWNLTAANWTAAYTNHKPTRITLHVLHVLIRLLKK